jgi:hypothetical protein
VSDNEPSDNGCGAALLVFVLLAGAIIVLFAVVSK